MSVRGVERTDPKSDEDLHTFHIIDKIYVAEETNKDGEKNFSLLIRNRRSHNGGDGGHGMHVYNPVKNSYKHHKNRCS